MKKTFVISLIASFLLLTSAPAALASGGETEPIDRVSRNEVKEMTKEESQARVEMLTERLNEIKSMDLDELSWNERRKLKKEVRIIEREMKLQQNDTGIYISGGALVVILILLILL
ncbi:hypothetical protein [Halocola ammonii]